MEKHGNPLREHPHVFNRFYKLRQRVEAGWHSLKSVVGDIIRNRTKQTSPPSASAEILIRAEKTIARKVP